MSDKYSKLDLTSMQDVSSNLHEWFLSLTDSGFTWQQACTIIGTAIATMQGRHDI